MAGRLGEVNRELLASRSANLPRGRFVRRMPKRQLAFRTGRLFFIYPRTPSKQKTCDDAEIRTATFRFSFVPGRFASRRAERQVDAGIFVFRNRARFSASSVPTHVVARCRITTHPRPRCSRPSRLGGSDGCPTRRAEWFVRLRLKQCRRSGFASGTEPVGQSEW